MEREQAAFCYLTARSTKAETIVEFGTSFGVPTIWLAAAARANGGRVISTELVPSKAGQAQQNIKDAGPLLHRMLLPTLATPAARR